MADTPKPLPLQRDLALDIPAYVDATAHLLALPLDPAHREGTIANFERICTIAQPLLTFPLPDSVEVAPVFTPE